MATAWYYALNGEQQGPVTSEVLMALVASNQLSSEDLVWKKGFTEWVRVAKVRELAGLCQVATPQATQAATQQPQSQVKAPDTAVPSEELRLAPDPEEVVKKQPPPQEVALKMADAPKALSKPAPKSQPQVTQWYYARGGKKAGPVTAQYLKEKAQSGQLLPTDHLWKEGLTGWIVASSLPGLKFPVAPVHPAAPPEKFAELDHSNFFQELAQLQEVAKTQPTVYVPKPIETEKSENENEEMEEERTLAPVKAHTKKRVKRDHSSSQEQVALYTRRGVGLTVILIIIRIFIRIVKQSNERQQKNEYENQRR